MKLKTLNKIKIFSLGLFLGGTLSVYASTETSSQKQDTVKRSAVSRSKNKTMKFDGYDLDGSVFNPNSMDIEGEDKLYFGDLEIGRKEFKKEMKRSLRAL